ncbi:bifunctional 4-hydroxy-2-oxoglutarate aldolase/2-dehydro-3-deoxy-phosphogluconate aldolase [Aquimarina sp. U1-2]|uniref:bifunctional 4-hydroxy-2-oxoglutarate aldolase/2-dehydro-3-deoxy-phosphogluconate aldolase n=1 Tax=Aquimarina sp. U1-2 TaxID=2823141 RepID=UPI001AEC9D24|nr:bifunctional 4-hydroxy-2-oxoglutarate aldolase/2-dehydro-3-deoxy-phosphogluconate aldolase [Aquimarina sp. U1-2]MBP2831466.1 bifunctional 4-hydroxy-2-oxoglutarate aldolase/2-dehydro-3-deoxy-phosphogluconate aldolase [Aquimarina sp. U1-2]
MAHHKSDIIEIMEHTGMIPVFNHKNIEIARKVLDAAYHGGVRVFEFTNRGDNALEVFTELAAYAEKYEDLILGIGTIFDEKTAQNYLDKGAQFIVSPALVEELASFAHKNDVLWIPGCSTVTEVYRATRLGAEIIKAFPGNMLGPAFVKAITSVMPWVKVMPTGGVSPTKENLNDWFKTGVSCVGMGSQLFKKEYLQTENYQELSRVIAETLTIIKNIRN